MGVHGHVRGEGHAVVRGVQVVRVPALARLLLAPVPEQILEGELPGLLLAVRPKCRVEEQLRVDASVRGADDGCPGAAGGGCRGDDVLDAGLFLVPGPVGLVQDDEVCDGEVAVDLRMAFPGGVELGGVDDLDQSPVHDVRILAGEDHAYEFLRLGQSAGLDHDHVETGGGPGQRFQEGVEFARVDRAAQAAVAQ